MIQKLVNLFSPLLRHGPCIGLRVYKFGRFTSEVWFCPPKYKIEPHNHPNENIELMFLWGSALFSSRSVAKGGKEQIFYAHSPGDSLKHFTVKAGDFHTFAVSNRWLVFINFSEWLNGFEPTSAADDFNTTV